jgi:hypothetical protein
MFLTMQNFQKTYTEIEKYIFLMELIHFLRLKM